MVSTCWQHFTSPRNIKAPFEMSCFKGGFTHIAGGNSAGAAINYHQLKHLASGTVLDAERAVT